MRRPRTLIEPDYEAMSRRAAALIDQAVRERPTLVLALPTGATPVGMYAALVDRHRRTGTDWSQVTTFNLDEYAGVGPDDPESYAAYMRRHLFQHVNLNPGRCHLPNGLAADPVAEAARYEAAIDAAGGIDLAVLGIGTNGHLGFNEPGSALTAATHLAELSESTWRRNFPHLAAREAVEPGARARYRHAYTMGIGTILQARRILLLASGAGKRAILREAIEGPVTTANPASLLQLHPDVTLVLDREAGAW